MRRVSHRQTRGRRCETASETTDRTGHTVPSIDSSGPLSITSGSPGQLDTNQAAAFPTPISMSWSLQAWTYETSASVT